MIAPLDPYIEDDGACRPNIRLPSRQNEKGRLKACLLGWNSCPSLWCCEPIWNACWSRTELVLSSQCTLKWCEIGSSRMDILVELHHLGSVLESLLKFSPYLCAPKVSFYPDTVAMQDVQKFQLGVSRLPVEWITYFGFRDDIVDVSHVLTRCFLWCMRTQLWQNLHVQSRILVSWRIIINICQIHTLSRLLQGISILTTAVQFQVCETLIKCTEVFSAVVGEEFCVSTVYTFEISNEIVPLDIIIHLNIQLFKFLIHTFNIRAIL